MPVGSPATGGAGPAVAAGASAGRLGSGAVPLTYANSVGFGPGTRPITDGLRNEERYRRFVSGSIAPPGQFVPPVDDGIMSSPSGPSHLLTGGGVKSGPSR